MLVCSCTQICFYTHTHTHTFAHTHILSLTHTYTHTHTHPHRLVVLVVASTPPTTQRHVTSSLTIALRRSSLRRTRHSWLRYYRSVTQILLQNISIHTLTDPSMFVLAAIFLVPRYSNVASRNSSSTNFSSHVICNHFLMICLL